MTADTCGEHKAALVCGKIYKKRRFLHRKYFFESATNRIGKGNIEPCSNFCIWRVTARACGESGRQTQPAKIYKNMQFILRFLIKQFSENTITTLFDSISLNIVYGEKRR